MYNNFAANIRIANFWDEVINDFLDGKSALLAPLNEWRQSYMGKGRGEVQDALPEPYLGNITRIPKAVFLALNPGNAHEDFQSREGKFAEEIRALGSYQKWAATWPYLREPWITEKGPNRHHRARLKFMRLWYGDANISADEMLSFELYPWHSVGLTAPLLPDHEIVREFIWEPIAALNTPYIFAFGADSFPIIENLKLEIIDRIGKGGRSYPTRTKERAARTVLVARTPNGTLVIAEKHLGGATPPSASEVALLKAEIIR